MDGSATIGWAIIGSCVVMVLAVLVIAPWLSGRLMRTDQAMGRLQALAQKHNAHLQYVDLSRYPELGATHHLARIEWMDGKRVHGGEGKGATAREAAADLVQKLQQTGISV